MGDTVVGVYLYGSGVTGGLRPQSDIDILVACTARVTGVLRQRLVHELLAISGRNAVHGPSRPLDVTVLALPDLRPWRFPPVCDLLFGEWLRGELEAGNLAPAAPRPDLAIAVSTLLQHHHGLAGPAATEVLAPVPPSDLRRAVFDCLPALLENLRSDERNVMLTLARMWVTLAKGAIVPKDAAAAWVIARLPADIAPAPALARSAYLGESRDVWDGSERQVDAFVRHAVAAIDAFR